MPLNIELVRDGEVVKGGPSGLGWGGRDLDAAYTVALGEALPDQKWNDDYTCGELLAAGLVGSFGMMGLPYLLGGFPLNDQGSQVVQTDHEFTDPEAPIRFQKGDVIRAWRS